MKQRGVANIFVIILGIFIIVVLFGYFRDKKLPNLNIRNGFINPLKDNPPIPQNLTSPYIGCGIEINSPMNGSTIESIFEFRGKVTGCGWNSQNGFIGNLEVLDENNNSLTDVINVPVNTNGVFSIKVGLKRQTTAKLGLVSFQSLNGTQVASFSVYLK